MSPSKDKALRPRSRLGKYRILGRLGEGGFARVYRAYDTIEGIPVALKVPSHDRLGSKALDDLRREVRLTAKLEHPNILSIKNADEIDGLFVVAYALGKESLADRMTRRMGVETALDYGRQLLAALAYAHERRIVHCDVKPDNLILFADGRLRLGDFGIARIALRTLMASGSGTLGYMAPEQAMGRPSFRSDVFAAGLILYRLLTGVLPRWPFEWPLRGHAALERKISPGIVHLLRIALRVDDRQRFEDAVDMHDRYERLLKTQPRWTRTRRHR